MADHEITTEVVSNSEEHEFLAVHINNPDDPYDGGTLAFTAEELQVFITQLQDALVQWKGETPVQPDWNNAPEVGK